MRIVFLVLTSFLVTVSNAHANPKVTERWQTYTVNATSADALRQQMKQRGPNGFWAYTRWYVRWTGSCKVTVEVDYTMPRHANRNGMPANLRQQWDRMLAVLKSHEKNHGAHGINAGRELVQKRCANGDAIIKKWANQDKVYDRRTNHGKTEGVVLP